MKILPIKTKEEYYTYSKYLDTLYGVELNEEQTNEVLVIQQLLEHYEQNNLSKVGEEFDTSEDLDYIYELIQGVSSLEKFGLLERVCKLQEEYSSLAEYIHKKTGQSLVGDTEIERFFIGRDWGTTSEAEIHIRQIAKNETRAGLLRRFDLEKETETLP